MKRTTRLPTCARVLYGADYNPDQWLDDESVLTEDVVLMKRIHATSASIGIFAWTALEPGPGVYTFEWLDATMDRFAKAGLTVFLATPSASKPMWLSELHPEIRRVGRDGRRDPSGGRHNHCLTSPVYRNAVQRINRELALRYGKHPALALWHVGNELNGECHCELCKSAFHDWLRRRYGSLEDLNRVWWTSFWNHTFTEWSQIPTFDQSIDGLSVDWLRFINDQHVSFLENEMAPLREFTPQIPCTTNFMGANRGTNYWQWSRSLDCISNDIYPLHDDREDSWRKSLSSDFTHSLMRGLAGGDPWLLMECSPSSVNWSKINKLKRPGVHLQEVLQAVANGADAIHYFQWRKGLGGYEKFHGAVIDHEGGTDSRVFQECAEVGRILKTLASVVGLAPERAPVGLVYDWEARWALEASAGPKNSASGDRHTEACIEHFRALRSAGIEVDIIPADADFSAYRALVTPALYSLPTETARRLGEFAAGGGTWIATYLTGYVDQNNRCWRGGFPGPCLREVFGLWNEEVDYLYDDEKVCIEGAIFGTGNRTEATDIVERIHSEGARVLATLASDFYAGSPVLLRNKWGCGETFYVGARLAEEGCISFYKYLASELNLTRCALPLGIVRKTRVGADGPVEFLFNYTRREVAVELGEDTFFRAQDGHACTGKTTLRPYDSLLKGANVNPASIRPETLPLPPAMNTIRHRSTATTKAFTLIELLTVIAIIGILAAIIIPTVGSVRKSASSAKALSNAKQISMANLLYAQDNRAQLLGWGVDGSEPVANAVLRDFAIYLSQQKFKNQKYQFSDRDLMGSLATYVDPLVPEDYRKYNTVEWTWSFNSIFNTSYGRRRQLGSSAGTGPRRLPEFQEPSRTLYLVSGGYELSETHAANTALLTTPVGRQPIFYYHGGGKKTPGVFLDGHAEMLAFPIDPKKINPSAL